MALLKTWYENQIWGTNRDDCTSRLPHFRTFLSHLTVIIGKNLQSSFFSFTFKPKILQSFISSQLTTWFCEDSYKTSMRPKSVARQIKGKIHTHLKKRSENPSYPIQLTKSQAMAQWETVLPSLSSLRHPSCPKCGANTDWNINFVLTVFMAERSEKKTY